MATAHRHAFSQAQVSDALHPQSGVAWFMRTDALGPRVLDRHIAQGGYVVPQGVLLLQFASPPQTSRIWSAQGPGQRFDLTSYPDGIITLTIQTDHETLSYALRPAPVLGFETILQISWDAMTGQGVLRAWTDGSDVAAQAFPLAGGVGPALLHDGMTGALNAAVRFVAVGHGAPSPGAQCGLLPGARVTTPDGARLVQDLVVGDRIRTGEGDWVTVTDHQRTSLPCCGQLAPMTLRAPYFDLIDDLTLLPHFDIVAGGPSVDYLFGQPSVRVPVQALRGYRPVARVNDHEIIEVVGLRLNRTAAIVMNGASVFLPTPQAEAAALPRRLSAQEVFTLRRFCQR